MNNFVLNLSLYQLLVIILLNYKLLFSAISSLPFDHKISIKELRQIFFNAVYMFIIIVLILCILYYCILPDIFKL